MLNEIKDAVLGQKEYRDQMLIKLKKSSNFEFVPRTETMNRDKYLKYDLIKVVLGPRRAGKSLFLFEVLKDQNFAYFNFDENNLDWDNFNYREFTKILHEVYGDFKYIYFDEIQNLPRWEVYLNMLHREWYNVFVSGSNANLLGNELATHLTGRHLPIEILPFSLQEFLVFKKGRINNDDLMKFLQNGGFPEVVVKDVEANVYLPVLYEATIFKDLINRHDVRKGKKLNDVGQYFLSNISSLYNATKLANKIGFKSDVTMEKYFKYFEEAYLLFGLQRYSFKTTVRVNAPRKVYTVDNGFMQTVGVRHMEDKGKFFENLVFTELLKQGFSANKNLFYFQTKNKYEVDFLLKDKNTGSQIIELVQVTWDLNNKEVEDREIRGLLDATKDMLDVENLKLTIITWSENREILEKGKAIKVVSFDKYFL